MDILAVIRDRAGEYDCPVCHRALDGCELSLVKDEDPMYTVQVSCAHCRVTFVVVLHVRHGRRRVRPPAPRQAPPIAADEVLDVRELLRGHTGSLTELLRR
ncbi:MAG TPA: hypothetical protein VGP96_02235 [Candidatus Dormibacteraeota bacterium]|nr:hypothetical protein [Candidatus Dormibacteraeota bacterium]